MGIYEGTITETTQAFYLERLFDRSELRPAVRNRSESLVTDGDHDAKTVEVDAVGTFDGGWEFWDHLQYPERRNNFEFRPLFCVPSYEFTLPDWTFGRYDLVNLDVTARVLYYPFGLAVARFRVYFESSRPLDLADFIAFQRTVRQDLRVAGGTPSWADGGGPLVQEIFRPIDRWLFGANVPDTYVGRIGERPVATISFLYDAGALSERERGQLIRRDDRPLDEETLNSHAKPYIGRFDTDAISVARPGAVIQTGAFDEHRHWSRRWKRLQLLNNLYLAYDFAMLEDQHLTRIRDRLGATLDDLDSVSAARKPLTPRALQITDDLLRFGGQLRGTRGQVYEQLEPTDAKESANPVVDDYIDRLLSHETILQQTAGRLPATLLKYIPFAG